MTELVVELAERLREKLKARGEGNPSDLVALRTAIQVMRPDLDQLAEQALPVAEKHFHELSGTFLDVGCYGGWLYPHVRHLVDYYGIDLWPSGIECARKMFGHRFELIDLFKYEKKHDVVWCSQILFSGEAQLAWDKCRSLANRLCIYVSPEARDVNEWPGVVEFYNHKRMNVAVWRNQ